jgi:hypothetical protein
MACNITQVLIVSATSAGVTGVRVFGESSNCETLEVSTTCTKSPVQVPVTNPPDPITGMRSWSVDVPIDIASPDCDCGKRIKAEVRCVLGTACSDTYDFLLDCGNCPTASSASFQDLGCINPPNRRIGLSVTITTPASSGAYVQWILTPTAGAPVNGPAFFAPPGGAQGPAQQVPLGPQTIDLAPGTYQANVVFLAPHQNCPGLASPLTINVSPCSTTTTTTTSTTPPPCNLAIQGISFVEGPCDAQGNRQLTAQAVVQGNPGGYYWSWDNAQPSVPTPGPTSPAITVPGGSQHQVTLTVSSGASCVATLTTPVTVSDCPNTTTTTSTTTTSTTSTTTTSTSTTQPPTTSPPQGMGCLCIFLLVGALAFIAAGAIALFAWACSGMINLALLGGGIAAVVVGLILLVAWILICARTACPTLFTLIDLFTALVVIMPILAAILALLNLPNCGVGALVDWGVFGIVLALLYRFGEAVGCLQRTR